MSKKIVDLPKADFDAVFLPGTIHSCEDEVYIIYFNAEGNDGNGCIEIEVCDYQTILNLYYDVDGNTEKFFDYLPDYFQGKWYYTNSDTVYFQELCEMYEKADFIVGRDGGATEEMKFIVKFAKGIRNIMSIDKMRDEMWDALCELSGEEVARLFTDYHGMCLLDYGFREFLGDEGIMDEMEDDV